MSVLQQPPEPQSLATTPVASCYTYSHLDDLNCPKTSYRLPLAVIALVDMNAFFAQVEQIRLGLSPQDPVVCAQWQSLIAVSYAARKYGINRMDTIQSAQSKCPNLVVGHAAVFKKGESHWSYLNEPPNQAIHKVSLDPYRRESRKILKIFQENCDLVEKASVDESYLDLGRLVYQKLMELFPQLAPANRGLAPVLPPIPSKLPSELHWVGEVISTDKEDAYASEQGLLSESQKGEAPVPSVCDWDDVCMLIGSQILLQLRQLVYQKLGYFTSGGLARNKLVAKVAGGFRKPDNQTIVRTRLVHKFLNNFQLNDISGMGGKMGDHIVQKFDIPPGTNTISYIREQVSLEALEEEIPEKSLAKKVYDMVRGDHKLELTHRVEVKSMMSRKNFMARKPLETFQDAYDWIVVFAGDLYNRLIELDDESLNLSMLQSSNKDKGTIKRPKTITVAATSSSYSSHSRQAPIPLTISLEKLKSIFETMGMKLLRDLLDSTSNLEVLNKKSLIELEKDKTPLSKIKIHPIANLSLVISGFVKTNDTSLIDTYGGRGENGNYKEDLKKMFEEVNNEALLKKTKISPRPVVKKDSNISNEDKKYINKLFTDFHAQDPEVKRKTPTPSPPPTFKPSTKDDAYIKKLFQDFNEENQKREKNTHSIANSEKVRRTIKRPQADILQSLKKSKPVEEPFLDRLIRTRFCNKCQQQIEDVFEHSDYHIALDLSEKLNKS
ncbi:DNA polymerase eta subunit [Suhomyces tanzawaensis NRRL Y-17324]|uniref:DNA polymerase eta subunit n=1 Tax=Suhomyces tanzawaensis NRRL Y-17324 TaxID=984487 RepID=A0A1E4SC97_9ASCO|nr:DNA polymerase eta subunit [Suhomyces tanzawaensis NRRL Y-17324]ODV77098.1 DNA polymerase eta subunit [Suhomyces tanzawaensis NRRL Y-17324]